MRVLLSGLLFFTAVPSFSQSFKYEDLVDLIKDNHLQRIEDVLPLLPKDFRSRYTLMRDSRSLQAGSDLDPRVIMFGRDAKLTCTFNGDVSQRGFDTLECFQFREVTDSFDFRQIQFPTPQNGLVQVEYSESNRSADKKFACSGCHGGTKSDPRPNWNHYSVWAGAYGESDDTVSDVLETYKIFTARRDKHPRYQWLIQDDYEQSPYMGKEHFDTDHRPNLRLSEAIGRMMGLRDRRIMKEKLGEFSTLAFAVSTLKCLFTDEQQAKLKAAGVDLEKTLDVADIFGRLQVMPRFWTTTIFNDPPSTPQTPWDHQFGYTYLKELVTMATVQDLAKSDAVLADAVAQIKAYFATRYKDEIDYRFYQDMNDVVVGLDFFGGGYYDNQKRLCGRMAEVFTERATWSSQSK